MNRTHPDQARIAIVGAGPGGLTCARVLQQHGINVTVYESDAAVDSRSQGGTLDMHADSGQIALTGAGLQEEFRALARPEGQAKRFFSPQGELLIDHQPAADETAAPEIDRGQLRRLLAISLQPGTVEWGCRLKTVSPQADGTHTLHFTDGTNIDTDLVIGADGAWSRVRPNLSRTTPEYTGVCFVEAHFSNVDTDHHMIAGLVGDGHLFSSGDYKGLIAQRNSNSRIGVFIGICDEPDWYRAAGIDPTDTAAMRAELLTRFAGWDNRLLTMITDNDGPYVNRPIYAIRAPHTWPHTAGLTLLGDAGHLRTPFGGNGANLAMLEGYELATTLAEHTALDKAVRSYEQVMQARNKDVGDGITAIQRVFGPGDRDLDTIPDFDQAADRYKQQAADYQPPIR
jgi:2-polyprenyl-6-methoxyphenol hydroxylase-like FAD-dependent oxidoreductase